MVAQTIPLRLLLAAICFHSVSTLRADESISDPALGGPLVLANRVLDGQWTRDAGRITALALTNKVPLTGGATR